MGGGLSDTALAFVSGERGPREKCGLRGGNGAVHIRGGGSGDGGHGRAVVRRANLEAAPVGGRRLLPVDEKIMLKQKGTHG